jgi:hypothetical protein
VLPDVVAKGFIAARIAAIGPKFQKYVLDRMPITLRQGSILTKQSMDVEYMRSNDWTSIRLRPSISWWNWVTRNLGDCLSGNRDFARNLPPRYTLL